MASPSSKNLSGAFHPKAIGELVQLMRENASAEHPIFLTTHGESIVRQLNTAELYLVSKLDGKTKVSPAELAGVDKTQIPLDTAWLANLFDGGLAMVKVGFIVEGESENWWWSRRCFSSGCTTMIAPWSRRSSTPKGRQFAAPAY